MGQASYFGSGSKPEAQRAENGGGVLEEGADSLLSISYGSGGAL